MSQKIHYQDNIFFITILLKTLKDGLSLDIDSDFFLDKVLEDLDFIDSAIYRLTKELLSNERLIDRAEYLRETFGAEKQYSQLLSLLVNGEIAFSKEMSAFSNRLSDLQDKHRALQQEIMETLHSGILDERDDVDVVSQDELSELLREESVK